MPTSQREILLKQLSNSKEIRERVDLLERIALTEPTTPITFTTAAFVQPAVGGTVTVYMDNVLWMVPDAEQIIQIGKDWGSGFIGGSYKVISIDEEESFAILELQEFGWPSVMGASILINSPVAVSARDGIDGKTFATLTAPYTTPASGSSATAHVDSTNLFVVGDRVKLATYSHEVVSINVVAKTVALKNLNAPTGITSNTGSKIIVAIAQDATEISTTAIQGISPSASEPLQTRLNQAGSQMLRRAYTVTSVVGVGDGGTADNLAAVTPAALGFSNAAALETYLASRRIAVEVSGYFSAGDGGGGIGYIRAGAFTDDGGIRISMTALGDGWYWQRAAGKKFLPEWFGAISGNMSTALQGCFAAAASQGRMVELQGKTYGIATTIQIPSGLSVSGLEGATLQALDGLQDQTMLEFSAVENITLDSLTLDGARTDFGGTESDELGAGARVYNILPGSSNITFANCRMLNGSRGLGGGGTVASRQSGQFHNITYLGCHMDGIRGWGLRFNGCKGLRVIGGSITNCGYVTGSTRFEGGLDISSDNEDVLVEGIAVLHNIGAVNAKMQVYFPEKYNPGAAHSVKNVTVRRCVFTAPPYSKPLSLQGDSSSGIPGVVGTFENVVIENCEFNTSEASADANNIGLSIEGNANWTDLHLIRNIITKNNHGLTLSASNGSFSGVKLIDNTVYGNTTSGLRIFGSMPIEVYEGNIIRDNGTDYGGFAASSTRRIDRLLDMHGVVITTAANGINHGACQFGVSDFSMGFQLRMSDYTPSSPLLIFASHSAGNNRLLVTVMENGDVRVTVVDGAGAESHYDLATVAEEAVSSLSGRDLYLRTQPLLNGRPYSAVIAADRDGFLSLVIDDLLSSQIDFGAAAAVDIGAGNANHYVVYPGGIIANLSIYTDALTLARSQSLNKYGFVADRDPTTSLSFSEGVGRHLADAVGGHDALLVGSPGARHLRPRDRGTVRQRGADFTSAGLWLSSQILPPGAVVTQVITDLEATAVSAPQNLTKQSLHVSAAGTTLTITRTATSGAEDALAVVDVGDVADCRLRVEYVVI